MERDPLHRTHTISKAEYDRLVLENLGGVYPVVAEPPTPRLLKEPRRFPCSICSFVGTTSCATRRHLGNKHEIGVQRHACTIPSCKYVAKWRDQLRQHRQKTHGIDVRWHVCDVPNCTFKTKTTTGLRDHKANIHNIGVVWHCCQIQNCTFRTKQRRNLLQHGRWMHSGRVVVHKDRLERNRECGAGPSGTCDPDDCYDSDCASTCGRDSASETSENVCLPCLK